jgi:hypothetical protein
MERHVLYPIRYRWTRSMRPCASISSAMPHRVSDGNGPPDLSRVIPLALLPRARTGATLDPRTNSSWTLQLERSAPKANPRREDTMSTSVPQLHAWSHDYAFQHHDVRAAFDNFTVVTGQLVWPGTPARVTTWGAIKELYR